MLRLLLLMATTIVSGLTVFSDQTGHGNQSHLVYAANQQRWWCFNINTKTATVVSCYVSSSNDLTTATWSAGTDSPALAQALQGTEQRNLGCLGFANGSTDVVHVSVSTGANSGTVARHVQHVRATFTGASSITWESWDDTSGTAAGTPSVMGNALGMSTTGVVHEFEIIPIGSGTNGDPNGRLSTNADTAATWTTGFGTSFKVDDAMPFQCTSFSLAKLASAAMIVAYANASVSNTQSGGLKYNLFSSGTWPNNTGAADVGIGTSTQDSNDWAMCGVNTTHTFAVRRDSSNSYLMRMYNGASWASKTAPPTQAHKAASGIFLATDGTDVWMFVLDSTGNNALMYCKYTVAGDSWGSWTQLEAAGSTARNYISGCPVMAPNHQIGIIFTQVNGANFDLMLTVLDTTPLAVGSEDDGMSFLNRTMY